ncbi:MAG: glutathione S-transferase N-terminal domain-containing protein, partial [Pseudomonadota bacterium]|nr:glutathione S-transferase N-terminal domain-containing protein [Pseudomonadota bacterium]
GRVQVPYLEDPNSGEGLFESARILAYLEKNYG